MSVPGKPEKNFVDTKKGDKQFLETSGMEPKYIHKKVSNSYTENLALMCIENILVGYFPICFIFGLIDFSNVHLTFLFKMSQFVHQGPRVKGNTFWAIFTQQFPLIKYHL